MRTTCADEDGRWRLGVATARRTESDQAAWAAGAWTGLCGAGWSQEATAKVAAMADGTILSIEQARDDPRVSTLVRLAFVFGAQLEIRFKRRRR